MTGYDNIQKLNFASDYIDASIIRGVENYVVDDAIAVNLSAEPMLIGWDVPSVLPRWKAAVLKGGRIIKGSQVGLFRIRRKTNLGGVVFQDWDWLGNRISSFPRDAPLYISPQDSIGDIDVDPFVFTNERTTTQDVMSFEVKLNLWWAPGNTDCFIHNEHSFLEVHTQIYGAGRMQKFRERDEATMYEDVVMSEGLTHDPFCRVGDNRNWIYPWHRYYADTDCVWLAIELHPKM